MRTTLAIDDDVLAAAKAIAHQEHRTVGDVVSSLARRALHRSRPPSERNGFPLLVVRDPHVVVGLELVNALRDEPE